MAWYMRSKPEINMKQAHHWESIQLWAVAGRVGLFFWRTFYSEYYIHVRRYQDKILRSV